MFIVHLKGPLHIFPLEPEYNEREHAESVEKAGSDHVHVQQRVNVIQQSEDNSQDSGEQEPPVDASIEVLELAEYFVAEGDLVHGFAPNKLQALEDGCWKQEVFFDDPEPNSEVVELAKADELCFAPNKSLEVVAPTLEAS